MATGEFSGEPRAIWLTEAEAPDRRMRLTETFWFRDPGGKTWEASSGAVVDGASIPRALWTVVGSPYTGDYRRASIVHDVACDEAGGDATKRAAADRMFFHACRTGGCSIWQSIVLYVGVRIGAVAPDVPAWGAAVSSDTAGPRLDRSEAELRLERDFRAIASRVLADGETEDALELERRTHLAMVAVTGLGNPTGPN